MVITIKLYSLEKVEEIYSDILKELYGCDKISVRRLNGIFNLRFGIKSIVSPKDVLLADEYGWEIDTLSKHYAIKKDSKSKTLLILPEPILLRKIDSEGIVDGGKRMSFGEGLAEREPADGKGRYDLITPFGIRRLAVWYELGAKKYTDRNWEKGMPFSRYIDAAKRHLDKYIMGMTDEDHLAAAAWNILSIMHHEELGQMEFDDMPHYMRGENYK